MTFFPHLVAGPIVRPRDLLPQFEAEPKLPELYEQDEEVKDLIDMARRLEQINPEMLVTIMLLEQGCLRVHAAPSLPASYSEAIGEELPEVWTEDARKFDAMLAYTFDHNCA